MTIEFIFACYTFKGYSPNENEKFLAFILTNYEIDGLRQTTSDIKHKMDVSCHSNNLNVF
jgi:hypothetical protein